VTPDEVPASLASYGIAAANVLEANESEDSMFVAYRGEDGQTWALVIEFDERAVREAATYLRAQGVRVTREQG
jgi:hypothetical protein